MKRQEQEVERAKIAWFDGRKGFGVAVLENGEEVFLREANLYAVITNNNGPDFGEPVQLDGMRVRAGEEIICLAAPGPKGLRADKWCFAVPWDRLMPPPLPAKEAARRLVGGGLGVGANIELCKSRAG